MTPLPEGVASPEDVERLDRLLRASFGQFRVAVVRAREERHAALVQWLLERIPVLASWVGQEGRVQVLDISQLRGVNLLQEMKEHLAAIQPGALHPSTVLILFGFEAAERRASRRSGPLQQLNVQRDVLVRAFPCPWIVLMDPALDRVMGNIAPDFADFVALRIGYEDILSNPPFKARDDRHSESRLVYSLGGTFTADQLRGIARALADEVDPDLPSGPASPAHLAHVIVEEARRHGQVDELIDIFAKRAPERRADTQELKRARRAESADKAPRSPLVEVLAALSPAAWEELLLRLDIPRVPFARAGDHRAEALITEMSTRPEGMDALLRVLQDIQKDRY